MPRGSTCQRRAHPRKPSPGTPGRGRPAQCPSLQLTSLPMASLCSQGDKKSPPPSGGATGESGLPHARGKRASEGPASCLTLESLDGAGDQPTHGAAPRLCPRRDNNGTTTGLEDGSMIHPPTPCLAHSAWCAGRVRNTPPPFLTSVLSHCPSPLAHWLVRYFPKELREGGCSRTSLRVTCSPAGLLGRHRTSRQSLYSQESSFSARTRTRVSADY